MKEQQLPFFFFQQNIFFLKAHKTKHEFGLVLLAWDTERHIHAQISASGLWKFKQLNATLRFCFCVSALFFSAVTSLTITEQKVLKEGSETWIKLS